MCPATGHGINSLAVPVSVHEGFDSVVGASGGDRKRAWPPCTASTAWRGVSEKPRRRPHACCPNSSRWPRRKTPLRRVSGGAVKPTMRKDAGWPADKLDSRPQHYVELVPSR